MKGINHLLQTVKVIHTLQICAELFPHKRIAKQNQNTKRVL